MDSFFFLMKKLLNWYVPCYVPYTFHSRGKLVPRCLHVEIGWKNGSNEWKNGVKSNETFCFAWKYDKFNVSIHPPNYTLLTNAFDSNPLFGFQCWEIHVHLLWTKCISSNWITLNSFHFYFFFHFKRVLNIFINCLFGKFIFAISKWYCVCALFGLAMWRDEMGRKRAKMNEKWKMNDTCHKNCHLDAMLFFSGYKFLLWVVLLLWCHNFAIWTSTEHTHMVLYRELITEICYCQVLLLNSHSSHRTREY